MFFKRFLVALTLLLMGISFTGTSNGTSGVSVNVNAYERTGLTDNFTTYWTEHVAFGKVSADAEYYGSYSADASVSGDDDAVSGYYSGGVFDSANAYVYHSGQHGDNVSGFAWARASIRGTANGSSTAEEAEDSYSCYL